VEVKDHTLPQQGKATAAKDPTRKRVKRAHKLYPPMKGELRGILLLAVNGGYSGVGAESRHKGCKRVRSKVNSCSRVRKKKRTLRQRRGEPTQIPWQGEQAEGGSGAQRATRRKRHEQHRLRVGGPAAVKNSGKKGKKVKVITLRKGYRS